MPSETDWAGSNGQRQMGMEEGEQFLGRSGGLHDWDGGNFEKK